MNRFAFLFNRYKKIDAAFVPVSILHIPKNERQGWFMRTTFFYPLHADLLRRQLEWGEKQALDARFSLFTAAGKRAICHIGACYRKPISHT